MRPPSHSLSLIILFVVQSKLLAQDVTNVDTSSEDNSDNLDLEIEEQDINKL